MATVTNDDDSALLIQLLLDALMSSNTSNAGLFGLNSTSIQGSSSDVDHASLQCPPGLSLSSQPPENKSSGTATTVMVRNIPKKCTQRMLLNDLMSAGYGKVIDFLYLPTDISSHTNLGYAFINFVDAISAKGFRSTFQKKQLECMRGSRGGLSLSYAIVQGFEANIANVLKNPSIHRIKNPEYLPVVLSKESGRLVPYHPPCDIKRRHSNASTTSSIPQDWSPPEGPNVLKAH